MGLHSSYDGARYQLPKGAFLRSHGPISSDKVATTQDAVSQLLFDPAQNGWVPRDCVNDFGTNHRRAGWPVAQSVIAGRTEISLRSWHEGDAHRFSVLLDNPAVWRYLPNAYPGPISTDMARDLIALSNDTDLHTVRAIISSGTAVGQVRLEFGEQDPELSYWLGQPYWGKGLASRAVATFVKDCFESDPDLDHMIARVKPENRASLRVLEKVGFAAEARSNVSPDWIILRCDRST